MTLTIMSLKVSNFCGELWYEERGDLLNVGISENSFYRNNTDNINIGYKGIFSYKDSQSIHST